MQAPCITAVLMGALTVGFVTADVVLMRGDGLIHHLLLGSLATILFYALCVRGQEQINWVFIFIFLSYLLAGFIYGRLNSQESEEYECDSHTHSCHY
jgi:hypothetical protein